MVAYVCMYIISLSFRLVETNIFIFRAKDGSCAFESMPPKHKCVTHFFNEGRWKMYEWEVLKGEELNYGALNFNGTLSKMKGS